MGFTFSKRLFISLLFAKKKRMKIDQARAELQLAKRCEGQNQKLQKLNFLILLALEVELLDCIGVKKCVKCAVRRDQSGYTFAIALW